MKHKITVSLMLLVVFVAAFQGCEEDYIPKPKGYARIDFEPHAYQEFTLESCPFTFEYSQTADVERVDAGGQYDCWFNIVYPRQNSKVHFSYYPISAESIEKHISESRKLAIKHLAMADDFEESTVVDSALGVYGVIYDFQGSTASNLQFYLTDSVSHFIRGALYFEVAPNADSLAPAEKYIEEEMLHLINSFQWKSEN